MKKDISLFRSRRSQILGNTFATFNLFGKMPNEMHCLRIADRDRTITWAAILRKYGDMSSQPPALFNFRLLINQ